MNFWIPHYDKMYPRTLQCSPSGIISYIFTACRRTKPADRVSPLVSTNSSRWRFWPVFKANVKNVCRQMLEYIPHILVADCQCLKQHRKRSVYHIFLCFVVFLLLGNISSLSFLPWIYIWTCLLLSPPLINNRPLVNQVTGSGMVIAVLTYIDVRKFHTE